MPFVSRVSDLGSGTCRAGHTDVPIGSPKSYTVTHTTGANTVFVNNKPMTVIGSQGTTDCGHTTTAISGSSTVFAQNKPVHRIGDVGIINEGDGSHSVITGSNNVAN